VHTTEPKRVGTQCDVRREETHRIEDFLLYTSRFPFHLEARYMYGLLWTIIDPAAASPTTTIISDVGRQVHVPLSFYGLHLI
jgi:hypothetical protein